MGEAETDDLTKMASEARNDLYETVMRYRKPLNILVVGEAGAGKSSFINSVIRATIKKKGQWAASGSGDKSNITRELHRYNLYFPYSDNNHVKQSTTLEPPDVPGKKTISIEEAPNIIDVCGLPDENTAWVRMLLRLLLYGHFKKDDENILDVTDADMMQMQQPLLLLLDHQKADRDLVIDRVIVVAAAHEPIPYQLIQAVMETAQPTSHCGDGVMSKRVVPVFGLMTKMDVLNEDRRPPREIIARKRAFLESLSGTGSGCVSMCQNYVSHDVSNDSEKGKKDTGDNDPAIDETLLSFMCNVCDPSHQIRFEESTLQWDNIFRYIYAIYRRFDTPMLPIFLSMLGLVVIAIIAGVAQLARFIKDL